MLLSRVLSRASRAAASRLPTLPPFRPIVQLGLDEVPSVHTFSIRTIPIWQHGVSFSTSAEPNEKDARNNAERKGASANSEDAGDLGGGEAKFSDESAKLSGQSEATGLGNRRRTGARRTAFSDSESEDEKELSADELAKLLAEKEELLKSKHKEIEKMQDKVLRSYADMENVMDRARREAENSKKYAIQNFAKSLLDVADNLGRASSVVKESFSKLEVKDGGGAVPLLKTLLEGVEMTDKQLGEVFKKYGLEKYDPINEPFDPHRHNAMFQVPDTSKPPGTVAAVLKAGYILHDRVIRPAEVGVTQAAKNDETSTTDKEYEASAKA
ncbi:hypothetical protein MLD38_000558 [Melastoma candidum]|uniref:Uncharacterized protein n=1 Tax=Melastoma candidum TaxID=119954 RepID=A0ACB9SDS7_9MYRT|nr:hypothetical protein MLD38_000558 [Melastoma candidum]